MCYIRGSRRKKLRESYLEVDLNAISYNLKQIKEKVGDKTSIMPVVKANAYGLGVTNLKEVLLENEIKRIAVAIPEEAIELKNQDFPFEIMILNEILPEEANKVVENNFICSIALLEVAKQLDETAKKQNKKVRVHIEIETGMGRVGVKPQETLKFMRELKKYRNLEVEGIYTHFSNADVDEEYTKEQIGKMDYVIEKLKKENLLPKYIHASASSGILNFKQARYNLVRPGIILYGYFPDEKLKETLNLKPATKLKSKVTFVKTVPEGTPISYGRTFQAKEETRVATVPLGYADGLRRILSNQGEVIIRGKRAKIIGNICMDNFMVDVTNVPDVQIGDEVILWDNEKLSIEEMAQKCHTINYEILCTIGQRIPRKYIK